MNIFLRLGQLFIYSYVMQISIFNKFVNPNSINTWNAAVSCSCEIAKFETAFATTYSEISYFFVSLNHFLVRWH